MSTNLSVAEAKKQLRHARLAEHIKNISSAIAKNDLDGLAKACSGFASLYKNTGKKVKK